MADDALRDVLDQHWQQLRHVEQLRYSFTNIYVVIVAGLLAVAVREGGPQDEYTAGFLIFLSFVGIIINVKLGLEFYHRMTYVRALTEKLGVEKEMGQPLGMYGDDQQTGFAVLGQWKRWKEFLWSPPSARTSEIVSPGHWVLALHVVGLSVSVGWFVVTFLDFGIRIPSLDIRVGAGILTAGAISVFSFLVLYRYTHGKFERIDELVAERVGDSELSSRSDEAEAESKGEANDESRSDTDTSE